MMKTPSPKKQTILITAVIVIGILLAALILILGKAKPAGDSHGHADTEHHADKEKNGHEHKDGKTHADEEHHADAEPAKGPHGGKLLTKNGYGVEVTVFEQGGAPEFRLYSYLDGKPLEPGQSQVALAVERLGRKPEAFKFIKEKDYFKSTAPVEEPHSFTVTIDARHKDKSYRFAYTQAEARIAMSDQQLQQNGVEILTAGPARIQSTLQLIGEIRFNEDRTVHIVPRLAGIVESVAANAGDRVRKGQVLAVISSQSLADQRGDFMAAQKRLALAQATYDREKKLWEEKISAEQDYLQARTVLEEAKITAQSARQKMASLGGKSESGDLTRYEIRSPIDGIVTDKRISIGTVMKDDAEIFVISDLSTIWVDLTVRAQDLNTIKTGQNVTVRSGAFEAQATGSISHIGSLVGEQSRTAKARVVLANPKGIWRPGLPVNVEVAAEQADVPVAVALESLQSLRDWNVVFGRYGDKLEPRPLELGRRDGKFVEVIKGLSAGEKYAAKNSFLIKAELGKTSASHDH